MIVDRGHGTWDRDQGQGPGTGTRDRDQGQGDIIGAGEKRALKNWIFENVPGWSELAENQPIPFFSG